MKRETKLYFLKTGILLAVYLALRFLLPLILPFFLAWMTVHFFRFIQKKIHWKLLPLSVCFLLIFILIAAAGIFCGFRLLYEPCMELIPLCQEYWNSCPEYLAWIPESASGMLIDHAPSVFSCLFGLFLYFISVLLLAKDWDHSQALLMKLPFAAPVSNAGRRVIQSIKGWTKAQFRIMAVVTAECAVGYFFLRIPMFLFWAFLTGFVDALPVFGTGTVFIPWLIIVLLRKNYTLALWLALLFLATWLTRELLEPKLLGDGLGLPPIGFLMSVVAGLQLFGAIGLFSGPFGILMVKELWAELEMSVPPESSWSSSSGDGETLS